jgi:hypothetical protein
MLNMLKLNFKTTHDQFHAFVFTILANRHPLTAGVLQAVQLINTHNEANGCRVFAGDTVAQIVRAAFVCQYQNMRVRVGIVLDCSKTKRKQKQAL